ncbi:MAG TPA: hypothetical protein RMH99_18620 [Sandaracinaceae bacterium LLY-WYZ-13_1]|nr:hypothetical protein [Sandaracinaceae bacterium LLY-WYZ-13_1]
MVATLAASLLALGCDLGGSADEPAPAAPTARETSPSAREAPPPEEATEETPPEPANGRAVETTELEERLTVSPQSLLGGRFSIDLPGTVSFATREQDAYVVHDHSALVDGRSVHLLVHEMDEGADPAQVEGPRSSAARLYALTQGGEIEHEGERTVGEDRPATVIRFRAPGAGRSLYHDLLVFDADGARFYVHVATAGRYLQPGSLDHIARSFSVEDEAE